VRTGVPVGGGAEISGFTEPWASLIEGLISTTSTTTATLPVEIFLFVISRFHSICEGGNERFDERLVVQQRRNFANKPNRHASYSQNGRGHIFISYARVRRLFSDGRHFPHLFYVF
jgi:hypothetical protein